MKKNKMQLEIISDARWNEIHERIAELDSIYDVWDHGSKQERQAKAEFYAKNADIIATDLNYLVDEIRILKREVNRLRAVEHMQNEDLWMYKRRAEEYLTDLYELGKGEG